MDHVAAMNIKSRIKDREISRFTPYTEVKKILDERFLRRKESRVGARIVPLGTTGNGVRDTCVEDGATAHGRALSKPRQRKLDVGGVQPPTRPSSVPVDRAEHSKAAGERRQERCIECVCILERSRIKDPAGLARDITKDPADLHSLHEGHPHTEYVPTWFHHYLTEPQACREPDQVRQSPFGPSI